MLIPSDVGSYVSYNAAQSPTDAQKLQARQNIGVTIRGSLSNDGIVPLQANSSAGNTDMFSAADGMAGTVGSASGVDGRNVRIRSGSGGDGAATGSGGDAGIVYIDIGRTGTAGEGGIGNGEPGAVVFREQNGESLNTLARLDRLEFLISVALKASNGATVAGLLTATNSLKVSLSAPATNYAQLGSVLKVTEANVESPLEVPAYLQITGTIKTDQAQSRDIQLLGSPALTIPVHDMDGNVAGYIPLVNVVEP